MMNSSPRPIRFALADKSPKPGTRRADTAPTFYDRQQRALTDVAARLFIDPRSLAELLALGLVEVDAEGCRC